MDGSIRRSSPFLAAALLLLLPACSPPEHVPVPLPSPSPFPTPAPPLPTPEPSPTPLYVPYKRLDTGRIFNGVELQTTFSTEPGGPATAELSAPSSYSLHLDLHVRVPRAVSGKDGLVALNPSLPSLFPNLDQWLASAKVSPFYERLYRHKVQSLQQNLLRLDQILTRHDFFDCETMLEIQPPGASRKILWIQSDMDVDSDGSDSDRVPGVDANSQTFQPLTSYKWPKRGDTPNPFIAERETRLQTLEASLATRRHRHATTADQDRHRRCPLRHHAASRRFFPRRRSRSYIVIPGSVNGQKDDPYSPGVGDYCAVVYGNTIYPAIVGDVGPLNKVGEASLRIAQELNPLATSENRPVSALKITYLVFPGTAERPFSPPDLAHWHDRVDALLKEAGGYTGQLFAWKDLTVPPPTPTPTPTPSATPTPTPSPLTSPTVSPFATPFKSPSPSP